MVNHSRTLLIICGQSRLGWGNYAREQGRADAHLVFVVAREIGLLFIAQGCCGFLDGEAIMQHF